MRLIPHRLMIGATLLTAACGKPEVPEPAIGPPPIQAPASVMAEIVGRNVMWGELFARGDAEALARMYTPNAVLMTPQGDLVGTDAIRDHFILLAATRTDTILSTNTATEALDVAGPSGYETGTLIRTLRPRGDTTAPPRETRLRYSTWWERAADGQWLIRRSLRAP